MISIYCEAPVLDCKLRVMGYSIITISGTTQTDIANIKAPNCTSQDVYKRQVIIPADSVASISCGMENTVLPSDSRGNDFISELLWIIRMRSRPARKRNLPSTKALSAPGTAGTGRQKKIPAGPEIIPWYTRSNGSTESFR